MVEQLDPEQVSPPRERRSGLKQSGGGGYETLPEVSPPRERRSGLKLELLGGHREEHGVSPPRERRSGLKLEGAMELIFLKRFSSS